MCGDGVITLIVCYLIGGPYQEYFYIELPVFMDTKMEGASRFKRFVYVHEGNTSKFPMHFGVEVAAKVTDEILIDYFVLASL